MSTEWIDLADVDELEVERGAAALVGDDQIALFRLFDGRVVAVQQLCPVSGAYVMARGIVGSRGERATVASPIHKQVYDLVTGECLDGLGASPPPLRRWAVRVQRGRLLLGPELAPA